MEGTVITRDESTSTYPDKMAGAPTGIRLRLVKAMNVSFYAFSGFVVRGISSSPQLRCQMQLLAQANPGLVSQGATCLGTSFARE